MNGAASLPLRPAPPARPPARPLIRRVRGPQVNSGGILMSWVDEWWKGQTGMNNGPGGTWWWTNLWDPNAPRGGCPDYDASRHSPCGFEIENKWDDFWNEEWFGIFGAEPGCAPLPTAADAASTAAAARRLDEGEEAAVADILTAREAYYRLSLLWTRGGCTVHNISTPLLPWNESSYQAEQADYPWCGGEMEKVPPLAAAAARRRRSPPPRVLARAKEAMKPLP